LLDPLTRRVTATMHLRGSAREQRFPKPSLCRQSWRRGLYLCIVDRCSLGRNRRLVCSADSR
jgi:hypothetical protein